MTRHPPNPKCDCDHCYVTDLNAVLRRFVEQREKGKVPADPDAEQLAGQVGALAGELRRVG